MDKTSAGRVARAARILMDIRRALSSSADATHDARKVEVSLSLPDVVELLAGYLNDEAGSADPSEANPTPVAAAKPDDLRAGVAPSVEKRLAFDPRLGTRFVGATDADG